MNLLIYSYGFLGVLYLWNAHSLDVTTLDVGIKYVCPVYLYNTVFTCMCV